MAAKLTASTGSIASRETINEEALTVRNLSNELASVSEWYMLGIKLGVQPNQLRTIEESTFSAQRKKADMLDTWLRCNPSASWRDVVTALHQIGEDGLAEGIKQKHLPILRSPGLETSREDVRDDTSREDDYSQQNLNTIKRKFAEVLLQVQTKLGRKLQKRKFKDNFRLFVISILPGASNCIPPSSDVNEIFEAITRNELWDYWHYYPLEHIVKKFGGKDTKLKKKIEQYKKDRSGYQVATKLKHHITAMKFQQPATEATESTFTPARKNPQYFIKLSLKLDECVAEYSLDYLEELWESLTLHLLLPPLAVLLDSVSNGCVSFLVQRSLLAKNPLIKDHLDFFEKFKILKVLIDDECASDIFSCQDSPLAKETVEEVVLSVSPTFSVISQRTSSPVDTIHEYLREREKESVTTRPQVTSPQLQEMEPFPTPEPTPKQEVAIPYADDKDNGSLHNY